MFTAGHYLYLLRFPLFCVLTLGLFGPIAHHTSAQSLLSGMFDLGWWPVVLVAMSAAWLAVACLLSTILVLRYGTRRFGMPLSDVQLAWCYTLAVVLCLAALATFLGYVGHFGPGSAWSAIVTGLFMWAVTVVVVLLLRERGVGMGWNQRVTQWLAFSPEGYTDDGKELLDLHGVSISIALGSHAVYALLGIARGLALAWPNVMGAQYALQLPTLACVLLLVTLICWTGGALTFFLDRYRIPSLLVVVVFLAVAARWPQSDHFFDVVSHAPPARLVPAQVLDAATGDSAIIVAVSGGGIQAEAWSTRVLTGLQQETQGQFGPAVRLISSVSGGSVGTMHVLGGYRRNGLATNGLPEVFARATASSLDDVAWGLIYPDMVRLVVPFFQPRGIGRGWALERAWADGHREYLEPLSAWREPARAGTMPAVIFNATTVETGARVVFSTVDWDRSGPVQPARTFYEVHAGLDVAPVTAARLSASFPYVSPAARANADLPKSQRFHFVDGGYWDNFGVASAVEFIEQAVSGGTRIKHLLLIQIRDRKTRDLDAASGYRGGLFQVAAPVEALFNVRSNGQTARNAGDLELLQDYLKQHGVTLTNAVFEAPQDDAPLSWHLTPDEIGLIRKAWNEMAARTQKHPGFCTTIAFLRQTSAAAAGIAPCA